MRMGLLLLGTRSILALAVLSFCWGCGTDGATATSDVTATDASSDTVEIISQDTSSNRSNDFSEADSATPLECPENSFPGEPGTGTCLCEEEYHWNEDGSACVQCPENRIYTPEGTCECPSGFIVITDGTCQDASQCPPNSYHKDGGDCHCMEGHFYTGDPTVGCLKGEDWPCPENSHFVHNEEENTVGCSCNEGLVPNFWKNTCVTPGEECSETDGWKKVVVNGELWMCCPPDSSTWLKSEEGQWQAGCTCDNGQPFDTQKGICP